VLHRVLLRFRWSFLTYCVTPQSGNRVSTSLGNSGLCWTVFARNRYTAMPAEGNGDLQTLICVFVARPRRCLTLLNLVPWQNWMAAYLAYTRRMKTLFRGWPVMAHEMHMRRRSSELTLCQKRFRFWSTDPETVLGGALTLNDRATFTDGKFIFCNCPDLEDIAYCHEVFQWCYQFPSIPAEQIHLLQFSNWAFGQLVFIRCLCVAANFLTV